MLYIELHPLYGLDARYKDETVQITIKLEYKEFNTCQGSGQVFFYDALCNSNVFHVFFLRLLRMKYRKNKKCSASCI